MYIADILGIILGKILRGEEHLTDNEMVIIDVDLISKMLTLCNDEDEARIYEVIDNGRGCDAIIKFGRSPDGAGVIESITLANTEGESVTCMVAEHVEDMIDREDLKILYHATCEAILS